MVSLANASSDALRHAGQRASGAWPPAFHVEPGRACARGSGAHLGLGSTWRTTRASSSWIAGTAWSIRSSRLRWCYSCMRDDGMFGKEDVLSTQRLVCAPNGLSVANCP